MRGVEWLVWGGLGDGDGGDGGGGVGVLLHGEEEWGAVDVDAVVVAEGVKSGGDECGCYLGGVESGDEGAVLVVGVGFEFGEEAGAYELVGEEEEDGLWDLEVVGHGYGGGASLLFEVGDGVVHYDECECLLEVDADEAHAAFEGVAVDVLYGEGYFAAGEDDGPCELEPSEEEGEEGEAAVDCAGAVDSHLEGDVDPLHDLEGCACYYAGYYGGQWFYFGVGEYEVEEGEEYPDHDVGGEGDEEVLER